MSPSNARIPAREYAMPTSPPAPDNPPLGVLFELFAKQQSELDQRIGDLVEKLDPFLELSPEVPPQPTVGVGPGCSRVAQTMHERIAATAYQTARLNQLIHRLHL